MDFKLDWTADGPDVMPLGGELELDPGLETAVLLSLFSDARARDEDGRDDRRGFWGDREGDRFGSRLWLYASRGINADLLEIVRREARLALAWMVREEIAREIDVQVERDGIDGIVYRVALTRGGSRKWGHLWQGQDEVLEARAGAARVVLVLSA